MTYSSALSMSRGQYSHSTNGVLPRRSQSYAGRNQNVVSFSQSARKLGPISNTIILVVLVCLLGLLYLTQVTKTNAFGYQISGLQHQQAQLQSEHDDLALASARMQSLDRVQHSSVAGSLVAVAPSGTVQN